MLNHCVLSTHYQFDKFRSEGCFYIPKSLGSREENEELLRYQSHRVDWWYPKNYALIYDSADDWGLVATLSRV